MRKAGEANGRESAKGRSAVLSLSLHLPFSLALLLSILFLAGCTFPGSTQPIVKIGLVAPFEGRYRSIGYEAIYAARLAIREINAQGGVSGYRIELVALDDRGQPDRAIESARQLAIDPQVVTVIGHYRPDSTEAAIEEDCRQQMALIAIESSSPPPATCRQPPDVFILGYASAERWKGEDTIFVSNVPDPNGLLAAGDFVSAYNVIPIDGTRAGPIALQTYDAMYLLFDALNRAKQIDRAGVAAALAASDFSGLGGHYAFDSTGNLVDARVYVYEYDTEGHLHEIR